MSSPEPCQRSPIRGNGAGAAGGDHHGVHVLHSPTRPGSAHRPATPESDFLFAKGTKGRVTCEPGPGGPDEVFSSGRWPCELPRHHKELLEGGGLRPPADRPPLCPTVGYAASLELQLSRNLSDDMKEVAYSVRNAIRSSPGAERLETRQVRDTACQTNGFTTRGTQTTQTISVGLQTDVLRNLTSSPHRCLTPKGGGSTPISSPSRRKVQYSPVVQNKFERPCCSPKYGSPKLQRKLSTSSKADLPTTTRAPTPTTPQKGNSESAWARSTTTRDSPVHTTINDGLSSLFNIIDHTPVAYDPLPKFTKSPSRSRPAEPSPPGGPGGPAEARSLGAVQEFLRTVRGRSPSPVQLIVEVQGEKTPEVVSMRQDLSAPPGYTLAENAARILNKKLLEQSFKEEKKLQCGNHSREAKQGEPDRAQAGYMEDLPCSPVAPPLESRFLRPARPARRRPPSRWAAHSPSSSPRWSEGPQRRFTFPLTGTSKTILELEEPGTESPPA